MNSFLFHARATADTARHLALIYIADTAYAVAAWADTRDLDVDWADFQEEINR